jgi:hypothetical protein
LLPGPVTGAGYNVRSTTYRRTGQRSINLAFTQNNESAQWVELDRVLIPKAGAMISYHRRMSFVTDSTFFAVQYCINNDGLWKDIPGTTAQGTSALAQSAAGQFFTTTATRETESSFSPHLNIALPEETIETPTRIRLVLRKTTSSIFITAANTRSGVFVDDISFNEVDWISDSKYRAYPKTASEVTLDATTAGELLAAGTRYTIRLQPRVGQTWMRASPLLEVVASDNERPTLDAIASSINLLEDAETQFISLTGISAGPNENQSLTVTATSLNPQLIPHPSVSYNSPDFIGTLSFKPALNQSGTARISVTVSDGQSDNHTVVRTFLVNVAAVNDAPTVSQIADRTINEGGSIAIPFAISDVDHPSTALTVSVNSNNSDIIPPSGLTLSGSGANRRLTVRPAAKRFGTCAIMITASDGQDSSTMSFQLTVNNVNDLPTLDVIPNLVITEDDPMQTITLTGISAGPFEDQPITVTAVSNRPLIIPNPTIEYTSPNNTATLKFTPLPNANGIVSIRVNVHDGELTRGNFTRTFRVTVRPVNDQPTITALEDITLEEDTPSTLMPFTISDVETAPSRLRLSRFSSNTTLLPTSRITFGGTGNNRHVIVNPAPNQFGTAVVTITVSDGGLSDSTTFLVTVNPVNDAPTLALIRNPAMINEDAAEQTIRLTGITSGAANESQTLSISATSSHPALIPHPTVIYTSPETIAFVKYRPEPNMFGTAVITIMIGDGADKNSSFSRTFSVAVRSVNDAPTITPISPQTIQRDGNSDLLTFHIADVETDATALVVTRATSNVGIIPLTNIVLGGTAGDLGRGTGRKRDAHTWKSRASGGRRTPLA